jgi:hypothetical protein
MLVRLLHGHRKEQKTGDPGGLLTDVIGIAAT